LFGISPPKLWFVSLTSNLESWNLKLQPSVSWVVTTWVRRLYLCSIKKMISHISKHLKMLQSNYFYKFTKVFKSRKFLKGYQANSFLRIALLQIEIVQGHLESQTLSFFPRLPRSPCHQEIFKTFTIFTAFTFKLWIQDFVSPQIRSSNTILKDEL
jgi:hypothetical protein